MPPQAPQPPVPPAPPPPPAPPLPAVGHPLPISSAPTPQALSPSPVASGAGVQTPTGSPSLSSAALPVVADDAEQRAAEAERRLAALSTTDVSQANSATIVYGDSGCGKTAQVVSAIEYVWETYHRVSMVYLADLGGYGNALIKLAKLGIARLWHLRNHVEAFETAELATLGYWPEHILDPVTGYADPHVRLIAPQTHAWTIYCPNGHPFPSLGTRRQLDSFQQQCPTCRMMTTIQNWSKVDESVIRPGMFKHVGARMFDSGTSFQDWVMDDMAGRSARGETLGGGEKNALRGTPAVITSGSMTFGSNSMQHYGFAQNRMPSWMANTRKIPGLVIPAIWTFLEQRGTDEGSIAIFGPKIAGNAKTAEVPSWGGNCLHLSRERNNDGQMKHRIWLGNHSSMNEGNVPHLAKHRGEPGTFEGDYLEDGNGEAAFSRCSLKFFFRQMDIALQQSLVRGVEQYPDAPALHPFTDEGSEEILSSKAVSGAAPVSPSYAVPSGMAGVVAAGAVPAGGVPAPPVMPGGIPAPPPPPPGAPMGAAPAVPAMPAANVLPFTQPAAPPATGGASVPVTTAPVATVPVPQPTGGASASSPPGGAPVRPPAVSAISGPPAGSARPARPPVPPPPGQQPPPTA